MTAFNIVRMRVKPGQDDAYLDAHRSRDLKKLKGLRNLWVVKTGEHDYFVVGRWKSMDALAAARPEMIEVLDTFRDRLEDLGGDLGVTEPFSGEVVLSRKS